MLICFSWIINNRLAVGSFPKLDYEIAYLSKLGITSVLCLTQAKEIKVPQSIKNQFVWRNVPMPDGAKGGVPNVKDFQDAYSILSRWQQRGHITFVHCLAGVERSPAVCALYLTQVKDISLEEAISLVQAKHSYAQTNPSQLAVMREFLQLSQN